MYVYVCTCVRVYVDMSVCVRVYVCMCVRTCVYVSLSVDVWMCGCVDVNMFMYACACIQVIFVLDDLDSLHAVNLKNVDNGIREEVHLCMKE